MDITTIATTPSAIVVRLAQPLATLEGGHCLNMTRGPAHFWGCGNVNLGHLALAIVLVRGGNCLRLGPWTTPF